MCDGNRTKISIIMPVYNAEKYLEKALDSAISQTLHEIEIICINDGSTDNSLNILEKYAKIDNRIKIITQKNQGQGVARNNGLEIFSGEYVMFLDCDDYFESDACEKCYKIAKEKNVSLVVFPAKTYSYDAPIDKGMEYTVGLKKFQDYQGKIIDTSTSNGLENFLPIAPWCKMYSKDYFKKLGIKFPEKFIFEDIPFTLEVFSNTEHLYICENCLYNYYYPRKNQTTANQTSKVFDIFKAFSYLEMSKKIKNKSNLIYKQIKFQHLSYWYTRSKMCVKIPYFLKMRGEFIKLYKEGWTDNDIKQVLPLDIVHSFIGLNIFKISKYLKQ